MWDIRKRSLLPQFTYYGCMNNNNYQSKLNYRLVDLRIYKAREGLLIPLKIDLVTCKTG